MCLNDQGAMFGVVYTEWLQSRKTSLSTDAKIRRFSPSRYIEDVPEINFIFLWSDG